MTSNINNFITGNIISTNVKIPTEPATPAPKLSMSDLAFYNKNPVVWIILPEELISELEYLKSIGFAIEQSDRIYVNRDACEQLYSLDTGIFVDKDAADKRRTALRQLYISDVLPMYARMTAVLAEGLPATTYDGLRARKQATEIQTALTRLTVM